MKSQGEKFPILFHIAAVVLLVIFACSLRLVFFSGFVLGDDIGYADCVSDLVKGSYPALAGRDSLLAYRPVMLYFIALPIYLFGWFDWSFVLPIFLASIMNTVLIYIAGNKLANPLAGILAALAYATFPLDAVHATTMSNDILLSSFIWGGGLLLLVSYTNYARKRYLLLSFVSGFIVGAAVGIKINALFAPAVLCVPLLVALRKDLRKGGYKTLIAWVGGWLIANFLLCLFFYRLTGDFFAHYHTEIIFNQECNPSGYTPSKEELILTLLEYPKSIFGVAWEGQPGYQFLPYGFFFLYFFFCLPLVVSKHFKALRLPAFLAMAYLLIMQFAPMQLFPDYIPIHRLPRFLHIVSIPSALVIGIASAVAVKLRSRFINIIAWVLFLALTVTSVYWAYFTGSFYKDCAKDRHWAWETVKNTVEQRIITDEDMCAYLAFRAGYQPHFEIECPEQLPQSISQDSLVILGGARLPDLLPGYVDDWYKNRDINDFDLIAEAPFPLTPWRLSKLRVYKAYSHGKEPD
jgi:hypothetical protein